MLVKKLTIRFLPRRWSIFARSRFIIEQAKIYISLKNSPLCILCMQSQFCEFQIRKTNTIGSVFTEMSYLSPFLQIRWRIYIIYRVLKWHSIRGGQLVDLSAASVLIRVLHDRPIMQAISSHEVSRIVNRQRVKAALVKREHVQSIFEVLGITLRGWCDSIEPFILKKAIMIDSLYWRKNLNMIFCYSY